MVLNYFTVIGLFGLFICRCLEDLTVEVIACRNRVFDGNRRYSCSLISFLDEMEYFIVFHAVRSCIYYFD